MSVVDPSMEGGEMRELALPSWSSLSFRVGINHKLLWVCQTVLSSFVCISEHSSYFRLVYIWINIFAQSLYLLFLLVLEPHLSPSSFSFKASQSASESLDSYSSLLSSGLGAWECWRCSRYALDYSVKDLCKSELSKAPSLTDLTPSYWFGLVF